LAADRAGRAVDRELKRRRDAKRQRGPSQAVDRCVGTRKESW
jgi:hypothetical protein